MKKISAIPLKWRKVKQEGDYYKLLNSLWLEAIYTGDSR